VRTMLDPARASADSVVVADPASIALDVRRVTVDVLSFVAEAEHGLRLLARGETAVAALVLAAAERAYTGDVFADEPYDDWAVPVREEIRAVYLRVVRALADLARESGDTGAAVGYLHRILAKDPYDEPAHRTLVETLVGAGSHGEARRAFQRYADAMRALDLPYVKIVAL